MIGVKAQNKKLEATFSSKPTPTTKTKSSPQFDAKKTKLDENG
jgi:hypothetical protein